MRFFLPLLLVLFFCTCDRAPETDPATAATSPLETRILTGEAMGTYYRVTYLGDTLPGLPAQIDSLLAAFNAELSAWVPDSKLSQFNQSEKGMDLTGTRYFLPNLDLARRASQATNGAFDPTVGPLVKFWGFSTGKPRLSATFDAAEVERLRQLVGLDRIRLEGQFLHKEPGMELDFNASAKGYGVDLVSELLTSVGRPDHLIDIGGEMRGGGTKNGKPWNVAIRLPDEDRNKVAQAGTLPLSNGRSIATSGNYLSYYTVDGETFSHTINPKTGLVERNRLLSASVLAPDCATADAFATACMVLGPEAALELVEKTPELEGYFLVRAEDGGLEIRKSSGL